MIYARKINERPDLKAILIRTLEDGCEVYHCEYINPLKSSVRSEPFYAFCKRGFEVYTSLPGSANHSQGFSKALAKYKTLQV
jgi:hypothetical protein